MHIQCKHYYYFKNKFNRFSDQMTGFVIFKRKIVEFLSSPKFNNNYKYAIANFTIKQIYIREKNILP